MSYRAPVKDMLFDMKELANIDALTQLPGYEEAGHDTAQAIDEAGCDDAEYECAGEPDDDAADDEGEQVVVGANAHAIRSSCGPAAAGRRRGFDCAVQGGPLN